MRDEDNQSYLTVKLAPSFGTLTAAALKGMDESLLTMVKGVTEAINLLPPEERTWDNVVSLLMQSPFAQPKADAILRADKLIKDRRVLMRASVA